MFHLISKYYLQILISITLVHKTIIKNYLTILLTILICIGLMITKMIVMIMGGVLYRLILKEFMKYNKIIKYVSKKQCKMKIK